MQAIAKLLQLLGLVITPVGIFMNLSGQATVWQSLSFAAFGALLFLIGTQVEGLASKGDRS